MHVNDWSLVLLMILCWALSMVLVYVWTRKRTLAASQRAMDMIIEELPPEQAVVFLMAVHKAQTRMGKEESEDGDVPTGG